MAKPVTTDPNTLASVISGMGGSVINGDVFRFTLPLSKVKDVVPQINQMGLGVRKISERIEDNPTKLFSPITVATLELYRPPDEKLGRLPEW